MNRVNVKNASLHAALVLALLTAICIGGLSALQRKTAPLRAAQQQAAMLQRLREVTPTIQSDNDAVADCLLWRDADVFGDAQTHRVFRFRTQAQTQALVIEASAHQGYSGNIDLLIAIAPHTGTTLGVRVIAHKETPGLGDKIDAHRSDWILGLAGRDIDSTTWDVRKHDGAFDAFTGATITPRAVLHTVARVAQAARKNAAVLADAHANCDAAGDAQP